MNDLISKQLSKCSLAKIPEFNSQTKELLIKQNVEIKVEVDHCYLVELNDSLLNPPSNSILLVNWNNGSKPTCKYYQVDVSKLQARMIYVEAVGYDIQNHRNMPSIWRGWLPLDEIIVLEAL